MSPAQIDQLLAKYRAAKRAQALAAMAQAFAATPLGSAYAPANFRAS